MRDRYPRSGDSCLELFLSARLTNPFFSYLFRKKRPEKNIRKNIPPELKTKEKTYVSTPGRKGERKIVS